MRFQPGQSGNPAGRPVGSRNKKTLEMEELLAEKAQAAVKNVLDRADRGEPAAMRLCMERVLPTGANRPVAIISSAPEVVAWATGRGFDIGDSQGTPSADGPAVHARRRHGPRPRCPILRELLGRRSHDLGPRRHHEISRQGRRSQAQPGSMADVGAPIEQDFGALC